MANLPSFDEEQIDQLVANGKLSPQTADTIRNRKPAGLVDDIKAGASNLYEGAKELVNDGVGAAKDFFHEQNPDFNPNYVPSGEPKTNRPIASPEGPEMAPDKVDVNELAMAPVATAVQQKPIDIMGGSGLNSAFNTQQKGIQGIADAQSQGLQAQKALYDEAAATAKAYDDQIKVLSEERKKRADDHLKNLESAQKELEKAHAINPNRYWENKSTGSKIAATIGIFLGAVGSALQGRGDNPAMNVLMKAIDQDIDAQKDSYNRLKGKMDDRKSAYSLAMNELGNEQAALLAAKASGLQMAELKLKGIAAQTQSGEVKARAQLGLGAIQEEKAKIGMALQAQVAKSAAFRQAATGPGVEDPSILPEDQQKRVVKMPNGLYKPAISETAAKSVNEITTAATGMRNILKQMRALNNPTLPYSTKSAMAQALKTEYILLKKNAEQLGVLSEVDKEMVESTLGDPGGWRPGKTDAMIDLAEKNLTHKVNSTYQTYVPGFQPIVTKPAR